MVRPKLNKFAFYRFRYQLAYGVFALALAGMLLVAGFYLPGGLTDSEINSALISDKLNPAQLFSLPPDQLIYLPYRLLQAGSISLFGISLIGIKLPSLILGFASALGILYLLNLWYRRNVAIVAAIIAVTTNQFLLSSQSGQAGVAYIFLTTMILVAASMISRRSAYAKLWVLAGFVLAAISLYMPLNIYILVALVLTALIHPHARHMLFRRAPKSTIALGTLLFLGIISPLIAGIVNDPAILRTLLGFSEQITNFGANASSLVQNYTSFNSPSSGEVIAPVYGLGLVLLIGLGLYRLFSAKYTAKSYILSFWLVLLIPLVCLNPSFISITFVPVVLLIALAVDYLIRSWYRLFPRNPYARVFGLLPLAVLVLGLVVSSVDRYVYGLHYDRDVYASYTYDLSVLSRKLRTLDADQSVQLIVSSKNVEFYESYARHQSYVKEINVTTNVADLENSPIAIVEGAMKDSVDKVPTDILVTRTAENADRFYLYKNR
ncbi:MAG: glycosyltransferase family 39 protein [Patescibacteria group bacterium]